MIRFLCLAIGLLTTLPLRAGVVFEQLVANFMPVVSVATGGPQGPIGVTWPESATGWILQKSASLGAAGWTTSPLPVTTGGGRHQISIVNLAGSRFFRLMHP